MAQIFAADHPERVAGVILMDAIPPTYDLWATQTYPNRYPRERFERLEQVRAFAQRAAEATLREQDIAGWLTPEVRDRCGDRYLNLLLNSPNYWWTYYWQNHYIIASGAQVKAKGAPGDLPLTILDADDYEPGASSYHQELGRTWRELQIEQPQAVIDAMLEMIAVNCRSPAGAPLVGANK